MVERLWEPVLAVLLGMVRLGLVVVTIAVAVATAVATTTAAVEIQYPCFRLLEERGEILYTGPTISIVHADTPS